MRHVHKHQLFGSTALTTKGEEEDQADLITKAIGDLTQAFESKMTDIDARLGKVELKSNRPDPGDKKEELSLERKAFAAYLRSGNNAPAEELKALNTAIDPQGGYLAPAELSAEVIRDLVEYSPIRAVADVRNTTSPSVIYPTRGDLTNARWVGETQERTKSEITFGQKEVVVKELATFVDISNRLLADA